MKATLTKILKDHSVERVINGSATDVIILNGDLIKALHDQNQEYCKEFAEYIGQFYHKHPDSEWHNNGWDEEYQDEFTIEQIFNEWEKDV